jgi:YVTN family beta-propeller protein
MMNTRTNMLLAGGLLLLGACTATRADEPLPTAAAITTTTAAKIEAPTTIRSPSTTTTTTAPTTTTAVPLPAASSLTLEQVATITGDLSPKSIVHSGNGLFFAQNMMYRHTVTVYNRTFDLVATISDTVDLTDFGFPGDYQGAPVEAAFTSDGAYGYVSNYQMYGPGFSRPGGDGCDLAGWDESFVYRIDTATLEVDTIIPVGAVPKYIAVTPDDRLLLVANWCSFDVSVIETESGTELARVEVGRHPRGIAVDPGSTTAYVAVMGSNRIAVLDLAEFSVSWLEGVGSNPRHLVIDPAGGFLYATLNGEGRVVKIDRETGEVTARVATGSAPRSMAISGDGAALYVVNYNSDTVAKVDVATMTVLQTLPVAHHPIGITYDAATRRVWVSSYSGVITVFDER